VEAVAGHPYRNKPPMRVPVIEGRTRKLAAHGASIVLFCLVFRWIAQLFSTPAVVAVEGLLVVGTWLFTLRCAADNRAARALGWLLRILATADSALVIGNALKFTSSDSLHWRLCMVVVPVAGLLFVAARLHGFGLPKPSKQLLTVMAVCVGGIFGAMAGSLVTVYLSVLLMVMSFSLYVALWFCGFAWMLRVRRTLRIDVHEWWLDVEALPRVEWTSYARLGDGRVELVGAEGQTRWFDSYSDAIFWLDQAGFCSQEQALAQRLVDQPPAPLLVQVPRTLQARTLAQSY